jgi:clan AA aspartic protease (TIGR02281 family)
LAIAGLRAQPSTGLPASALTKCTVGQKVSDPLGKNGVIDWSGGDFCRIRYEGGESHGWMAVDLQVIGELGRSGNAVGNASNTVGKPTANARPNTSSEQPAVLRPLTSPFVYHADPLGHFQLTATVNGAPVRFYVDTGATFVSLSLADAAAAGIDHSALAFTAKTRTANGESQAAPVMLRNVSIGEISINDVPGIVSEKLSYSLLGMSFLNRLKGFEIREGSLTIR